jgi:hypothetical protein
MSAAPNAAPVRPLFRSIWRVLLIAWATFCCASVLMISFGGKEAPPPCGSRPCGSPV